MRPWILMFLVLIALGAVAWWFASSPTSDRGLSVAGPQGAAPAEPASPGERAALERPGSELAHAPSSSEERQMLASEPVASGETAGAPGGTPEISGRVVDSSGAPVAGARVLAAASGGFGMAPLDVANIFRGPGFRLTEVATDAGGRFRLSGPKAGSLRLAVRKSGFAPLDKNDIAVPAEPRFDLGVLVLDRGVVVAGRVVDSRGAGVAGARMERILDSTGQPFLFAGGRPSGALVATTDASGVFRVDELAAGEFALLVATEDHPDELHRGRTARPGEELTGVVIALEDGLAIDGRVVGTPAALAGRLVVQGWPGMRDGEESEESEERARSEPGFFEVRETKVAADGAFSLRGLRGGRSYELSAGVRDANEPWVQRQSDTTRARGGERGVEIAYRPESALTFRVVDKATGAPVTAFEVRAGVPWPMPLRDENGKLQRSHPEGWVRFAGLRPENEDTDATLDIEAVGYRDLHLENIAIARGADTDLGVLQLEPAPLLTVTVTDRASGAPVAGANVVLRAVEEQEHGAQRVRISVGDTGDEGEETISFGDEQKSGRTDERGVVRLSAIEDRRCQLNVRHPEYALHASEPFVIARGAPAERAVALTPGGVVAVLLLDPEGEPVAGGRIGHRAPSDASGEIFFAPGSDAGAAVTDADGVATFAHLEAGVHSFRPVISGENGPGVFSGGDFTFAVAGMPQDDSGWTEVTVAEGSRSELQLSLPALYVLEGRVREAGSSLAGAILRLSTKREGGAEMAMLMGGGGPTAKTDADGYYRFENQKDGEYELTVSHPSRAMGSKLELRIAGADRRQDVELPLSIIEGRVRTEDGKPASNVEVWVERHQPDAASSRRVMAFRMVGPGGGGSNVTFGDGIDAPRSHTDAEGHYSLRGVHSDVDLVVKAEGKGLQPAQSEPVRVAADQIKSGVDFELASAGSLEILTLGPDGSPTGECIVTAYYSGTAKNVRPKNAFIEAEGRSLLDGLVPGPWRVQVRKMNFAPGSAGAGGEIPEQTVEVEARKLQTLTFRVP